MDLYMANQLLMADIWRFGVLAMREALRQLHVDAAANTPAFSKSGPERARLFDCCYGCRT